MKASPTLWPVTTRLKYWWNSSSHSRISKATSLWIGRWEPNKRSISSKKKASSISDSSRISWRRSSSTSRWTRSTPFFTGITTEATAALPWLEDAFGNASGLSVWSRWHSDWRSTSKSKTTWRRRSLLTSARSLPPFWAFLEVMLNYLIFMQISLLSGLCTSVVWTSRIHPSRMTTKSHSQFVSLHSLRPSWLSRVALLVWSSPRAILNRKTSKIKAAFRSSPTSCFWPSLVFSWSFPSNS